MACGARNVHAASMLEEVGLRLDALHIVFVSGASGARWVAHFPTFFPTIFLVPKKIDFPHLSHLTALRAALFLSFPPSGASRRQPPAMLSFDTGKLGSHVFGRCLLVRSDSETE